MTISLAARLTNLPTGITARLPVQADVAACTNIVRAVDIHACGETTSTELEVSADIFSKVANGDRGRVVICQDENIVAFLNSFDEIRDSRGIFFDLFESPDLPTDVATEIAIQLITEVENYAKELMLEYGILQTPLKTALYDSDWGFVNALEQLNFDYHRTFWRMKLTNHQLRDVPRFPDGYTFEEYVDDDKNLLELHKVLNEAFKDYYDFNPTRFESFKESMSEPINDKNQWILVKHANELVGYIMGGKRFEEESFGYVSSIGVLREHRGQGIARALLLEIAHRDKARGMLGTILHGDSSNPTGAMKLYESIGMRTDRIYRGYRKQISID